MATGSNDYCWCGRPLHYEDKDLESQLRAIVARFGEYRPVEQNGKKYAVQRHYIALHGIEDKDWAALGFKEIQET
jgi:hypothetical protein